MKRIILWIIPLVILNACKQVQDTKHVNIKPDAPVGKDLDLERWREIIRRESYSIDISKTPNPFVPIKTPKTLKEQEEITPLELVGILIKDGDRYAILQDPLRRGYMVKKGDRLGNSLIKEIGVDYLICEEILQSENGKKIKRLRTITLKKER